MAFDINSLLAMLGGGAGQTAAAAAPQVQAAAPAAASGIEAPTQIEQLLTNPDVLNMMFGLGGSLGGQGSFAQMLAGAGQQQLQAQQLRQALQQVLGQQTQPGQQQQQKQPRQPSQLEQPAQMTPPGTPGVTGMQMDKSGELQLNVTPASGQAGGTALPSFRSDVPALSGIDLRGLSPEQLMAVVGVQQQQQQLNQQAMQNFWQNALTQAQLEYMESPEERAIREQELARIKTAKSPEEVAKIRAETERARAQAQQARATAMTEEAERGRRRRADSRVYVNEDTGERREVFAGEELPQGENWQPEVIRQESITPEARVAGTQRGYLTGPDLVSDVTKDLEKQPAFRLLSLTANIGPDASPEDQAAAEQARLQRDSMLRQEILNRLKTRFPNVAYGVGDSGPGFYDTVTGQFIRPDFR